MPRKIRTTKKKVIILGAGGRDFHVFLTLFKNNPEYEVVAFTTTQIPFTEGRRLPPTIAGKNYPKGIEILSEKLLEKIIREHKVDVAVIAYSDISNQHVMELAARCNKEGCDFWILSPYSTMIESKKPVIAITGTRTGAGKSTVTRFVAEICERVGLKPIIIRHPMPYGDLKKQAVQKFSDLADLDKFECTIEEREEIEPLIEEGFVVFTGYDIASVLKNAEKEGDVIIWDGGNNDTPFLKPDLHILVADPYRPGHELTYYPSLVNLMMADIVVVNKCNTADPNNIREIEENVKKFNEHAKIFRAKSVIVAPHVDLERKSVVIVEDGPTLTHGGMRFAAATIVARNKSAKIVDPKPYAVGTIAEAYKQYPNLGKVVPALGYSQQQILDLQETLNNTPADYILSSTIDLRRIMMLDKPFIKVTYELECKKLEEELLIFLENIKKQKRKNN